MSTGCSECEHIIQDHMGYASLFYAGTLDDVVLPKRFNGSSSGWESFPPNANICREDLTGLPRETLRDAPDGIDGTIYGLQSDSEDAISFLFGGYDGDHDTYRKLTNTFRFLSEDDAKAHFPKSVKRVQAERVAQNKRNEQESKLVEVLDYVGDRLGVDIKYFNPMRIPAFKEELVQQPKDRYDDTVLSFNALDGEFTVGQYPGSPHVHLEYSRQLGGPGDFLQAGMATLIAERTLGNVRGVKFLVDSGHHEGEVTGIYKKSSVFRHHQAPTIWVYSRARGKTGINRFLDNVQGFAEAVSPEKLKELTSKVRADFLVEYSFNDQK